MVGENRQALVTKNAVCRFEATKARVNVLVVVIEQANPPVSTKMQIGERGMEEEVFECPEWAAKEMRVEESVWLSVTVKVDDGKTTKEGVLEVVGVAVAVTLEEAAAVVMICALSAVAEAQS